jgi:hypothetical protein
VRRALVLAPLLALLLLAGPAGAATERPVVLLVHGGAWLFGKPSDLDQAAQIAHRLGMQPVRVDYPLGDIVAANRAVREAALTWRRRGRTVLAYGESVGGTMAELLAAECRVGLAVGNSSPPDLVRWPEGDNAILWAYLGGGDPKTRRRYSPALRQQCNPVLAEHSPADRVVGFHFASAYARKFPATVGLLRIPAGHLGPPRAQNIGLRWLVRNDGLGHYGLASPASRR